MPVIITFKCDRCGTEQTTKEQMWYVGARISHYPTPPKFYSYETSGHKLWCRACVDKLQLINFPQLASTPSEEQPHIVTLEEQIREIVIDEIEASR